ncbi:MAG TPA: adenine phosphoribosyltransferase [Rhodanobacteraceae bacterium]|nr:adenine phosphoribosyltransferase [Rhodanobacteraceae bacterium]
MSGDGAARADLLRFVRDVADFPKPGIVFKDLTPMLADARAFAAAVDALIAPFRDASIARVAGIEARGFIFGAAAARVLGAGFVPLRKPGKLPSRTLHVEYALEYGSDRLELHADAFVRGERVLLVDDVLATGGTLAAAARLCEDAGGEVVGAAVVAELAFLGGRARWMRDAPLRAVLRFE